MAHSTKAARTQEASWMNYQRKALKNNKLKPDQVACLNKIRFQVDRWAEQRKKLVRVIIYLVNVKEHDCELVVECCYLSFMFQWFLWFNSFNKCVMIEWHRIDV